MPSSLQGKPDFHARLASDEDAMVVPENARPTDDSPTVISKTPPIIKPGSSHKHKIIDLAHQHSTPESLVASLRGRRLAHYELIEPIGVGGMAAVIRARDTQLDRFVALKILPPEMAQQPDNIQRFHQEAKAAAKLDHENVARVFYCGEDQGLFFIAFEFVEGINLRSLMERRGPIPVAEALRYILQIATGLEHAASRGVVHRDVKPSNIIITPTGRAKLVDMGLARNLERRGELDLTQSGVTLGTFDYISPEQALEPREADARSDIYSLGCTLYHMLTGHPPAPEGTPAKKLQHHQHLAPIDPRQYNPSIPAEVVEILGKMIEKNPKDRYQRPIHLVYDLLRIAKKVGIADDLADGGLFVDAPLPSGPRNRPFLFIGLALALLVAVTLLLSLAPEPMPKPVAPLPPGGAEVTKPPTIADSGAKINPSLTPAAQTYPKIVANVEDLQSVIGERAARDIKSLIAGKIDQKHTGFTFEGKPDQRLVLESNDERDHATLLFHYENGGSPYGLVLEGGEKVIFRRIRFQIDSATRPDQVVAALVIRGARQVEFEQCIFAQTNVPRIASPVPIASIFIDSAANPGQPPVVTLRDCFFDSYPQTGGQAAIAINGPAIVKAANCAFEPHGVFFHFREKCTLSATSVDLQNCEGFVVQGPAFRFDAKASAQIRAARTVFSRPDGTLGPEGLPQPDLIYLTDASPIRYEGDRNVYHNLNALVERSRGENTPNKESDFQKFLKGKGQDPNSTYLSQSDSPWQLSQAMERRDILGFQLKYDLYNKNLGLQATWLDKIPEPPLPVVAAKPKLKIVDADSKEPGDFKNILQALSGAVDGDFIYIKHGENREVAMPPVELTPRINVTLRPFAGYHPILVLDEAFNRKKDLFLFQIQEGSLTFEQLEIRLDPVQIGYDAQSVVHLAKGNCVFDRCVLDLRAMKDVQLNVATFIDLEQNTMMKNDPPSPIVPRVEFRDCFVRGKGDLVSVRGCRPLQVEVKRSLIALAGQLLDVQGGAKMMPMDKTMISWRMDGSSVFTTEPAFALRSETGKGLAKTAVQMDGCLLVCLMPDQPMVLFKAREENLDEYLSWESSKPNFYVNFDKQREWKSSEYDKLTFPKLDEIKQSLWDATPDMFKPADAEQERRIAGFGLTLTAELEQRLMPMPEKADEN